MVFFKKSDIIIILAIITFSCNSGKNIEDNYALTLCDTLPQKKECIEYSIPYLLKTPAVIKILDLNYIEDILFDNNKNDTTINEKRNVYTLGIMLVDLGYTNIYKKNDLSKKLLSEISNTLKDLQINDSSIQSKINGFINGQISFDNRINTTELQNEIVNYFEDKDMNIYFVLGIYIESLYITTTAYKTLMDNNLLTNNLQSKLNIAIYKQYLFSKNISEKIFDNENGKYDELISSANQINQEFEKLNISIEYNEVEDQIDQVNINNIYMTDINKTVFVIRNKNIKN